MRLKQGLSAIVAVGTVVSGITVLTMQNPAPVEAVPVVRPSPELIPVEPPSETPEPDAAATESANSAGPKKPIFPVHQYPEDWYLPRPASGDQVPTDDVGYVNTEGNGTLATPVDGRRTSPFGMRMHPVLHVYKLHTGLDFAAPCGTPVGAAADGVVSFVGWAGGNGYMVGIRHGKINGYNLSLIHI